MPYQLLAAENSISLHGFFSLFEANYPLDFTFKGEAHNFWEMVYVIDGEMGASADDNVYSLSKKRDYFPQANGVPPLVEPRQNPSASSYHLI